MNGHNSPICGGTLHEDVIELAELASCPRIGTFSAIELRPISNIQTVADAKCVGSGRSGGGIPTRSPREVVENPSGHLAVTMTLEEDAKSTRV